MKLIVGDKEHNVNVTSHVLESDPLNPSIFHVWHCWKCGNKLMQFNGTEIMEVPGPVHSAFPIIILCRICKHRHLFHSIL